MLIYEGFKIIVKFKEIKNKHRTRKCLNNMFHTIKT